MEEDIFTINFGYFISDLTYITLIVRLAEILELQETPNLSLWVIYVIALQEKTPTVAESADSLSVSTISSQDPENRISRRLEYMGKTYLKIIQLLTSGISRHSRR